MIKWAALAVATVAIVLTAALMVGEMRYRDCVHARDASYRAGVQAGWGTPTLSYGGCSHSPL